MGPPVRPEPTGIHGGDLLREPPCGRPGPWWTSISPAQARPAAPKAQEASETTGAGFEDQSDAVEPEPGLACACAAHLRGVHEAARVRVPPSGLAGRGDRRAGAVWIWGDRAGRRAESHATAGVAPGAPPEPRRPAASRRVDDDREGGRVAPDRRDGPPPTAGA